jgi:hypothetical protein
MIRKINKTEIKDDKKAKAFASLFFFSFQYLDYSNHY